MAEDERINPTTPVLWIINITHKHQTLSRSEEKQGLKGEKRSIGVIDLIRM